MSLDVYLTMPGTSANTGSGIFIRENGSTKEISRAEWDEKFPGREPITANLPPEEGVVYSANITHNLGRMAEESGIYDYLWRPDEHGISKASELLRPLSVGLEILRNNPGHFKTFNPENGWGNYEGLVAFVREYIDACEQNPDALVSVSR